MTNEQWKDINGYGGLYQVSNLGRIKRVEREVLQWNPQLQKEIPIIYPKRYLKFEVVKGYNRVTLSKDNKQERFQVHRVIAEHFIPNYEDKPCVNHINHIRTDNRAENLEWCTHLENEAAKYRKINNPFRVITPKGEEKIYYVQLQCARELGISRHIIRDRLINGGFYKGFHFSYIRPLDK